MKQLPEMEWSAAEALTFEEMRKFDFAAVNDYQLPIELMMENAGLHLAAAVRDLLPNGGEVLIGVGPGNNGGGGLVAARRLKAWGYTVNLHVYSIQFNPLALTQFERAMAFGVGDEPLGIPAVAVDAYLGFSQRLPLDEDFKLAVSLMNAMQVPIVSLDVPTGLSEKEESQEEPYIKATKVVTVAAPKRVLWSRYCTADLELVDLGIPLELYQQFEITAKSMFQQSPRLRLVRS